MITDEELANLPDDPELAFVKFESIIREGTSFALDNSNGNSSDETYIQYISNVLAAKNTYGLNILSGWKIPSRDSEVFINYSNFIAEVEYCIMQIRIKHSRSIRKYSVAFDPSTKAKLRHLLEQMKQIVDNLDISIERKEAIHARISALDAEINRDRTRYEAIGDFWIGFCETLDEGVGKLENVQRMMNTIGALIWGAKKSEDEAKNRLPAPKDPKKIEPPRKQLEKPKASDDDIAF